MAKATKQVQLEALLVLEEEEVLKLIAVLDRVHPDEEQLTSLKHQLISDFGEGPYHCRLNSKGKLLIKHVEDDDPAEATEE